MKILNDIKLLLFGFYKQNGVYMILCPHHGITKTIEQGYDELFCIKCLEDNLKASVKNCIINQKYNQNRRCIENCSICWYLK